MSDDRRSVKTYVPEDQKVIWQDHADELGMSQSEFVRTMVQAGRRGFSIEESDNPAQPDPTGSDPRGSDLERRVEAALTDGVLSWEELVDAVFDDFEGRLEDALDSLQDRNRVRYNGREGGYTLIDE
ncbi:hypothetical protein C471_16287 [Halorubrum saccharovorum DSM 1137]|uniref:Uncharacterized protein n=1 Tax=Halorubrum saccharovorum DSM 1137 TaxID=1227484 RepID=M0DQE9_9EURY|nr:DUF5805 domain-containing protein [Halorubrum saccharovorum]ELZ36379.1 hypothetical protein C471_16287 [Halorubrum saccharovorum DSM 1137]